jgi:hypothetical protein
LLVGWLPEVKYWLALFIYTYSSAVWFIDDNPSGLQIIPEPVSGVAHQTIGMMLPAIPYRKRLRGCTSDPIKSFGFFQVVGGCFLPVRVGVKSFRARVLMR